MATTTSRLGLIKPDLTDPVDVGQLNSNADKLDASAGATVVTSATRPGSPWTGQLIYETDTKQSFVWSAGSWNPTSGALVVTSSTRPSTPFSGQLIYESDTRQEFIFVSGVWLTAGVPVGSIQQYAGATAPSGYLLCDGTAVSRATYARLFQVIGSAYGTGDGSTTFNTPDLRGRVAVGQDLAALRLPASNALGQAGGAATVKLSVNEMPTHSHAAAYLDSSSSVDGGGNRFRMADGVTPFVNTNRIANAGGDQPHNNLQPYLVTNFIVKF